MRINLIYFFRLMPMKFPSVFRTLSGLGLTALACSVWAAHPIVSDDTGTQGAGHWQYELSQDWAHETEPGIAPDRSHATSSTLTYGLRDNLDLAVSVAHDHDNDSSVVHNGMADVLLQGKWRFYDDQKAWSMALKPVLSLPTGSTSKGFGTGRTTAALAWVGQYQQDAWSVLGNAGLQWNRNKLGQYQHIWSASVATIYRPQEQWSIMADWSVHRALDPSAQQHPQLLTLGLAWHPRSNWDLDVGYRRNLHGDSALRSTGVGMAYRW
jgi:hypothetical protein